MKSFSSLYLLIAGFSFTTMLTAADEYEVPRTQWGHPDFQGVWNFSSDVPMIALSDLAPGSF